MAASSRDCYQQLLASAAPRTAGFGGLAANGGVLAYTLRRSDGAVLLRIRATDGSWSSLRLQATPTGISIDARTVAVWTRAGEVDLYSETGAYLSEVRVAAPRAVALRDGELVVLTTHGTIQVYDVAGGTRTLSRALPGGVSTAVSVRFGIATFTSGRRVYALRLADGRIAAIATAPTRATARIGDAGIVFAWNTAGQGTARFVPLRTVEAALARTT